MTALQLFRLNVRCACGRIPPVRITPALREAVKEMPPEQTVQVVHCRCGETYHVAARAIQNAA